ncbi:hypothetical protein DD238_004891 [Peronospora effusa]|uniref:Histone deacetylase complex subunit SAP18 n=1 Tax=Peronospora effusa TaxID=542832 RepID=A0A3M6VC83_9STRA|nr:hypothetical protein DD238_004891 [Peronospora effusa]RQM13638.1 hypothetical protein DD237_005243 [Peronospora effusa]
MSCHYFYYRTDAFEALEDKPIANELHIYTWPDATLREIADLVQDSNTDAQKPNMRLIPVAKVNGKALEKILKLTVEDGDEVLLFRACKYGNNKHKKKYSTVVTIRNHPLFYTSLNKIIKTKVDASAMDLIGKGTKRVMTKVKKTAE